MADDLIFCLASAVAAAGGLLAVTRRNPVYAAAWLMASLFALAVIFWLLHASFLGTVQVLLYAGAIIVLFVFVIMLLNQPREDIDRDRPPRGQRLAAGAVAVLLLGVVGWKAISGLGPEVSLEGPPRPSEEVAAAALAEEGTMAAPRSEAEAGEAYAATLEFGGPAYFGHTIYDRHLVAFELISLLVLAAIAGAVVLAKRELEDETRAAAEARPTDAEAREDEDLVEASA